MSRTRIPALLVGLLTLLSVPMALAGDGPGESDPQAAAEETSTRLSDVLEGASGVRVATMCTNCNVANVTLLGQTGDRVQVWQDGLPVVGGLGAIYLLNVMPGEAIASTETVRGAGTVLTGCLAGVGAILIKTLNPLSKQKPFFFASADLGSLDWQGQKLLGAGRSGKLAGEFVVTRAVTAGSDPNGDEAYELAASNRMTYAGTISYEISRRSRLRFDLGGYREDQRGSKGGYAPGYPSGFLAEDIDIRRSEASLGWDYTLPDHSKLTVSTRYTRRNQYTSDNSGIRLPTSSLSRPYYMIVNESARLAEARYERGFGARIRFLAGAVGERFEADGTIKHGINLLNPDRIAPQVIDDFVRHKGVFSQVELSLPRRLDITAGVRWDELDWTPGVNSAPAIWPTIPNRKQGLFLPRVRLAWKPVRPLAVSLSGGSAMGAPRPSLERICCGAMAFSTGVTEYPEFSRNYLLDLDYVPFRWWHLRGTAFKNDYEHYLQKMAMVAFDYTPSYLVANYSRFQLKGVEIATDFRFLEGRLSFGAVASHLRVESEHPIVASADILLNEEVGKWSLQLPTGMIPFVPKNQASAFVKWDDNEAGWRASVEAMHTGPMKIQLLPRYGFVTEYASTPGFWLVNMKGSKRFGERFALFGGIDNLTQKVQSHLADPAYEYNWGPLRGRYVYMGLSYEM